jgi:transcriptional regulator with XRE-family HTH domain
VGIGQKVKEYREKLGINQSELARRAGLTPAAVWQIENGRRNPNAETLRRLAEELGVSADSLLQGGQSDEESAGARVLTRTFDALDDGDRQLLLDIVKQFRERAKRGKADE